MNRISLIVSIITSLMQLSYSQVPGIGRCPNVNVMQNFDAQRYSGLWYEIRKYPFIFSIGGRCITANYALNADSTITVVNKQISFGKEDSIIGNARFVKPDIGSLTVTFPSVPFSSEGNYNVLYTDYDDFSVVYNCNSILGIFNLKTVWILSRSRYPSQQAIEKAYEVLRDNEVSTVFLVETDQKNCPEDVHFNTV